MSLAGTSPVPSHTVHKIHIRLGQVSVPPFLSCPSFPSPLHPPPILSSSPPLPPFSSPHLLPLHPTLLLHSLPLPPSPPSSPLSSHPLFLTLTLLPHSTDLPILPQDPDESTPTLWIRDGAEGGWQLRENHLHHVIKLTQDICRSTVYHLHKG